MRWRPPLAALVAMTVAALLLVAMSSASSPPTAAEGGVTTASGDTPLAVTAGSARSGNDPTAEQGDTPTVTQVAARADSPPLQPVRVAREDEPTSQARGSDTPQPDLGDCPEPLAGLFDPWITCQQVLIDEEGHGELAVEASSIESESVPDPDGIVFEPLGRPARKILSGPPGAPGEPRLYLTFDDGPSRRWTEPMLDLLDQYGARATFFPVGAYSSKNMDLIEEVSARGHSIGTHLWSHNRDALVDEELFRWELRASADLLGDHLTSCLRPPFGYTSGELLEWAGDEGFEVVLWGDLDPLDWQAPSTDELTDRILSGVRPGTILLLHEHSGANTLAALDDVLRSLDQKGWVLDEPICPLRF